MNIYNYCGDKAGLAQSNVDVRQRQSVIIEGTWRVNSNTIRPLSVSSGQVSNHFLGFGHWPLRHPFLNSRDWLQSLLPITHSSHTTRQPPTPRLALVRAGHRETRGNKKKGGCNFIPLHLFISCCAARAAQHKGSLWIQEGQVGLAFDIKQTS